MQRIRYKSFDGISWGELEGGRVHQLSGIMGRRTGYAINLSELSLLAPCEPKLIVCVGKNYAKHIKEMGGKDLPKEPGLFLKGLNTLRTAGDEIAYPSWTNNLQYEGELAVVIAKKMKKVSKEDALNHVLGYTCAIDITARDKQRADLQWVRGKSADAFGPIGPWLETDLDPTNLNIQTKINGEIKQSDNTSSMIFNVAEVLSYISQFMTLDAGDVVLTGTPEGVGPLQVGDTIEVTIEGIGTLTNSIVAEEN